MVVYGYVLLQGANLISSGSELLLEILDPGLIGGLVLPILGALPDAAIIVISGSKSSPQDVSVGVGTLAGSTILLLTIVWGGSTYLGRCDLDSNNESINKVLTDPFAFNRTGVTSSTSTMRNALIMILTAIPMLVVQLPASLVRKTDENTQNTIVFVGAVLCFLSLILYLIYQLVSPELLKSKIRAAKSKVRLLYQLVGLCSCTRAPNVVWLRVCLRVCVCVCVCEPPSANDHGPRRLRESSLSSTSTNTRAIAGSSSALHRDVQQGSREHGSFRQGEQGQPLRALCGAR